MTTMKSTMTSNGECPVDGLGVEYDPFGSEKTYEIFSRARQQESVFFCPEINYWVVTRRKDILEIFKDPETYSAQITLSPVTPFTPEVIDLLTGGGFKAQPVQSNLDGQDHVRIRKISAEILNPTYFKNMESDIRRIAEAFIEKFEGKQQIDLLDDLVYDLPAHVLFLILGIPDSDVPKVKRWADNRLLMTFGCLSADEQLVCARDMLTYWKYCEALVEDRIENRKNDYPSHLLNKRNGDDSILTINEINSVVFGLLLAGHETTTNQSANAFRSLLTYRDNWEALCQDATLVSNAVEECLRFNTAVICWRRKTRKDVQIAGIDIPKGANILLALASANHDESKFSSPEQLDIRRNNASKHLSFGFGKHFCIGATLAKIELSVLLEEMSSRYPNMQLVQEQEFDMIETISFRGPKHVLVNLN